MSVWGKPVLLKATGAASGYNAAVFGDGDGSVFRKLEADMPVEQYGSGDPSSTNIRQIRARNGVDVHHSSLLGQGGSVYQYDWSGTAGAIAGGTLDVLTGVLTVTHTLVDMGSFTWRVTDASSGVFWLRTGTSNPDVVIEYPASNSVAADMKMDRYKTVAADDRSQYATDVCWVVVPSGAYFGIKNTAFAGWTVAQVKTAMTGVKLAYKLRTPRTYQLTPNQVMTLAGLNTVWTDDRTTNINVKAEYNKQSIYIK